MPRSGLFITFEGGDGSGKSTQAEILAYRLQREKYPVVQTFEPGGTNFGNLLRNLILNSPMEIQPTTELLLFFAARAENIDTVIRPALRKGAVVICDRFVDSTLAYQGFGKGIKLGRIHALADLVTRGIHPQLTILLDIDPDLSLRRKADSGDRIGGHLQLGLDLGDPLAGKREGGWEIDVHKKIRDGYLELAHADPQRWLIIDATLSTGEIAEQIWDRVESLLDLVKPLEAGPSPLFELEAHNFGI